MKDKPMKPLFVFLICLVLLGVSAYAAPVLSDPFPKDSTYTRGGNINFSVNVSSANLDPNSVVLFLISQNAYEQGENWDRFVMACTSVTATSWSCSKAISFAIVGSDTVELFYFEANDTDGSGGILRSAANPLRFTLDRNPPAITISAPANYSYVSGNVTVAASASDTASGINYTSFQFSLDNATWNNLTGGTGVWNSLPYADNTSLRTYLRVKDMVGNPAGANINVTTDNEAPRISLVTPANGSTINGSYTFGVRVSDVYSGVNTGNVVLSFQGNDALMLCTDSSEYSCNATVDTTAYEDNNYTVRFTVYDAASNSNSTSIVVATKNNQPSISSPSVGTSPTGTALQGGLLKGVVSINVSITNPGGIITSVTLSLEDAQVTPIGTMSCNSDFTFCSYTWDTRNYGDGQHTLAATVNNILNLSLKSSTTVYIDNTKPSIVISAPQAIKGAQDISATVTDDNPDENKVTFKIESTTQTMFCTVSGRTLSCKSRYDSSQHTDGPKTLEVTAIDKLGTSATAYANISIDNRPPEFKFLKIEPVQAASPRQINFTIGLDELGSSIKSAVATIKHADFSATLDLVSVSAANISAIWYGKATIVSYGSHKVGIKTEDASGNAATYDEKGYFYIGPLSCGDGVCQAGENYCLCASDCAVPKCPDNVDIECSSGMPVCGPAPICGNGVCSSNENCNSCAADCGTCASIAAADKALDEKKKADEKSRKEGKEIGIPSSPDMGLEIRSVFTPVIGFIREQPLAALMIVVIFIMAILLIAMRSRKPKPLNAGV